jgi:hypothetical protein
LIAPSSLEAADRTGRQSGGRRNSRLRTYLGAIDTAVNTGASPTFCPIVQRRGAARLGEPGGTRLREGMTSETRERLKALERENRDQRIHQLSTPPSENRAGPAE